MTAELSDRSEALVFTVQQQQQQLKTVGPRGFWNYRAEGVRIQDIWLQPANHPEWLPRE